MKKLEIKNIFKNIISLLVIALHFVPFYIIIAVALKPNGEKSSYWLFPSQLTLENFKIAIAKGNLIQAVSNTLIITVFSVIIITVIGAMASYPLSRIPTRMNKVLLGLIVAVMMVPPLSVLVPIYRQMMMMGGINSYWGIILLAATYNLPMSIFMYTNFISTIPKALDEAALIDGCPKFTIFWRIILPSLKPVTASVMIMTGVSIWNDYSFQLYMLQKPKLRTTTLAISSFFAENSSNLNAAAAAALLAVLPLVIIYICLQKYFVQGSVDSAVK